MTELWELDAMGQAELVHRKEATALELAEAAIARIESQNPRLNCLATPMFDEARKVAAGKLPQGPLSGAPYMIKDLGQPCAGVRQTDGSKALAGYIADHDGGLVTQLRNAGLVIVGRATAPEFGNHSTTEAEVFGPTRNPWDIERTAGGSSGGSASAVAARMVPAASASDGAGSIRIPASCCGLFGLKPTRGRISFGPDAGEVLSGLAVEHAVTRSVRDSAALLDATSGPVAGDPYWPAPPVESFLTQVARDPDPMRIAWSARAPLGMPVHDDCRRAVEAAAKHLEELGHHVVEDDPRYDEEVLLDPMVTIWSVGNATDHDIVQARIGRPPHRDELEITTWELVERGRKVTAVQLVRAVDLIHAATRAMAPFFATYDMWLTPTLAQPPLPLGVLNQSYGGADEWWRFDLSFNPWNSVANLTGNPAMSVPLASSGTGLPIGLLFTGRYADESALFRLAGQLERSHAWAARVAP
ncbi:MAG TPA: amidase [Candidatus Dormibacteraeota bacterium]|nr:amidase [Candidatus Dormibacteraeota bacterium]